jgi:hypothetical protein
VTPAVAPPAVAPPQFDIGPESAGQDIARLALAIAELLRQLLERQAIRRMDSGALDETEQERVGLGLMNARIAILDVAERFGLEESDLNLDLGPLGRLL